MPNLNTFNNHFRESQLYVNRVVTTTIMIVMLALILVSRLIFLQVRQHSLYKTLALNNQVSIVPITPARGLIFDRNGILLAENRPAFSLEITPERTPNLEQTLRAIQAIMPLTDEERRQFAKRLKYKRRNEGIPIRTKLSEEFVAKFSVEKHHLPGVDIVARLIRHYAFGEPFAHVLGYMGPISEKDLTEIDPLHYRGAYYMGKTGLEKFYETTLRGKIGYQHIETDAKGRTLRVLNRIPPTSGANLHLSLDSQLQLACYQALQGLKGSIVAIDPNNGEVLALVSAPSFDPHLFMQGIDIQAYKSLQNAPDKPLFHRAIRGQYPPGSTVKPLAALQGLELGFITPELRIYDPGWYQLNGSGRLYRDWIYFSKRHGHGIVDLEKAIAYSCDTYFFTLAHRMGVRHLHDIYTRFGLGTRTEIDITGEAPGLVPNPEWKKRVYNDAWYPGDTLNIGIGQGTLLATPLQIAQVAALLANRGTGFRPHLVSTIETNHHAPIEQTLQPTKTVTLRNPKHWDLVIQAMKKVVHVSGGTASRISKGLQYEIAGKTGTAQLFNLKQNEKYESNKVKAHLRDHSWFIAFAPVDKPEIAIAVLIENKLKKSGADIARIVLDSFFNLKSSTTETSDTQGEDETDAGGAEYTE